MHVFAKFAALGIALTGLILTLPSSLAAATPQRAISDVDRIVVIVNDDVITDSDLSQRLRKTRKQLEMEKISAPPDAALKKQLLERMVLERLQMQLAAQSGIRISESDVDRAFETVARRNNLGAEEARKALTQRGMVVVAYRTQLRDQLTIQQLLEREIGNRVTVTDSEVENFLENPQSRAGMDVSYQLSQILIAIPAPAPPGGTSRALRSPNGFHIPKLNNKRGDAQAEAVTQTPVRHILLRPSEILSLDEAREKLLALRERIENGEDFAALGRAPSEDTGSAASGGDLGWGRPGQMGAG